MRWGQRWFDTDEVREAVLALDMANELLSKTKEDKYYWKWLIIVLHNAVQAFMVLALMGTNGQNVLTTETRGKPGKTTEPHLVDFLTLYKRIKSATYMAQNGISRKFCGKKTHHYSMKELNRWRNTFIHYRPCALSIGMPEEYFGPTVRDGLQIISFLAFDSNNVYLGTMQRGQMN